MEYTIFTTEFDEEWSPEDISDYLDGLEGYDFTNITNTLNEVAAALELDEVMPDGPVQILLDCSGSFNGTPVQNNIAAIWRLGDTLSKANIPFEILGYTTAEWRGGKSRKAWLEAGRPIMPGRLNEIRHLIFKSQDASWEKCKRNLLYLLVGGNMKENIDGEALQWASERARCRGNDEHLIFVTDGMPIDDSTLSVHPADYLLNHAHKVMKEIEAERPLSVLRITGTEFHRDKTQYHSGEQVVEAKLSFGYPKGDHNSRVICSAMFEAIRRKKNVPEGPVMG